MVLSRPGRTFPIPGTSQLQPHPSLPWLWSHMWPILGKKASLDVELIFQTVVLEKTLASPLDCKEIKLVHPKGNQSWIFIGSTEAEALILWPPDGTSQLIGKDPDAGEDWRQEEKGMTEEEMVGRIQWTWVWASSGRWWRTGKLGVLQSMGLQRVGHDWVTELNWTGGGNGKPLHYSCQENPMDREAWWVTVCRVAKSRTWQQWIMYLYYSAS